MRDDLALRAFFGRRKGKKLRPGQYASLQDILPALRLDLVHNAPDDGRKLFAAPVEDIHLEIGFGGGEHLLHEMQRRPQTGFIGVEPFVNGMAKLLAQLEHRFEDDMPGCLRLYDDDATKLLDWLPSGALSGVDLLYPDPWPKKKHWKRRFVNAHNLERIARVLRPGGLFRFASDIDSYVEWTWHYCQESHGFECQGNQEEGWDIPYPDWPGTRYEAKALREGRKPAYLTFRRI